jgi:hypothetical protein
MRRVLIRAVSTEGPSTTITKIEVVSGFVDDEDYRGSIFRYVHSSRIPGGVSRLNAFELPRNPNRWARELTAHFTTSNFHLPGYTSSQEAMCWRRKEQEPIRVVPTTHPATHPHLARMQGVLATASPSSYEWGADLTPVQLHYWQISLMDAAAKLEGLVHADTRKMTALYE